MEREKERLIGKLDETEKQLATTQADLSRLGQAYEELRNTHTRIRAWALQLEEFRKSIVSMVQFGMGGKAMNNEELEQSFLDVSSHAPLRAIVEAAAKGAAISQHSHNRKQSVNGMSNKAMGKVPMRAIDEESIPDNFANATTALFGGTPNHTPRKKLPDPSSSLMTSTPKKSPKHTPAYRNNEVPILYIALYRNTVF